jgi:hygromycin-B 4-O-kinase
LEQLDVTGWTETLPSVLAPAGLAAQADLTGTTGYGAWDREGNAPHATWEEYLADVIHDRPAADRRVEAAIGRLASGR